MADEKTCPHCGKPVPSTALGGICPECMLKAGLASQTEGPGATGPHGTKVVVPPPKPEEIAPLFPQLEILECLGRGGMGVVYKARQPRLNRLVALKILAREKEQDAQFAERFTREAQALARLSHPNIVTVHDFGEAGGHCYLVMEFVDGLNLRQVLQAGKMKPEQALAIVPKICEALQYAHEQGIVHRDIKPENILLDKQGRVKIADFGIAKIVGNVTQTSTSASSGGVPAAGPGNTEQGCSVNPQAGKPALQDLTEAGHTVGTPHYMAPEQVEKPQTVDHRADIYSLGVVFYEMLTGELPLGKFQPPSQKVQVDVRLDEVVLHALEKEPERRYQQASQVKTAVETIATTSASSGRRQSARVEPAESHSRPLSTATQYNPWELTLTGLGTIFFIVLFPVAWELPYPFRAPLIVACIVGLAICALTLAGWWPFPSPLFPKPNFSSRNLPGRNAEPPGGSGRESASFQSQNRFTTAATAFRCGERVALWVFILVVLAASLITFLLPRTYVASTRIELTGLSPQSHNPYYIQSEFEVIASDSVLEKVAVSLNLGQRWGKQFNGGAPLSNGEVVALLRHGIDLRKLRNTDMIDIRFFSQSPKDAAAIANKIAETYCALPPGHRGEIINRAVAPFRPIRPDFLLNIFIGVVAGGVIGIFAGIAVGLFSFWRLRAIQPQALPPAQKPDRFWRRFAMTVLALIILVPLTLFLLSIVLPITAQFVFDQRTDQQGRSIKETTRSDYIGKAWLQRKVTYAAKQASVQDIVQNLAEQVGLKYDWQKSFAQTDPLCRQWVRNITIEGETCQQALDQILKPVGLRYQVENGVLVLSRQDEGTTKSDYIGQTWFPQGDSIEITSVERTKNQMTVKGHYNLVSHSNALLALYCTSTNRTNPPEDPTQRMHISKGRGNFVLARFHLFPGLHHVSMYGDGGHCFASVYFGTKAEALEESKASWITNSPSATTETWSPELAPGEKPDLQKILDSAKSLMDEGSYEEALQHYLWYFGHSRNDAGQRGVRLSFALSDWVELGRRYPKAKRALIEIRNADTHRFSKGDGYADLFQEIAGINQYLNDNAATVALFKTIERRDPQLAQQCYLYAESLLVQNGDYLTCREYLGDPQAAFERIRETWRRMKQFEDQAAARNEAERKRLQAMAKTNSVFAHLPFLPAPPPYADKHFVEQTRQLIEILVATNDKAEAEKIQGEALAVLDDPKLKSAVRDAEEKIQKQKTSVDPATGLPATPSNSAGINPATGLPISPGQIGTLDPATGLPVAHTDAKTNASANQTF